MTRAWTFIEDGDDLLDVGVGAGFPEGLFTDLRDNQHAARMSHVGIPPLDTTRGGASHVMGYRYSSNTSGSPEDILRRVDPSGNGPWYHDLHMRLAIPDVGGATPFSGITRTLLVYCFMSVDNALATGYARLYDTASTTGGSYQSTSATAWAATTLTLTLNSAWIGTTRDITIQAYVSSGSYEVRLAFENGTANNRQGMSYFTW